MIDYIYTAKENDSGEVRKGRISANNKNAAAAILIEKSMYPIKIQDAQDAEPLWKKNLFGTGIKSKDKSIFTRQLSTLVMAGLPITQALDTAIDQVDSVKFKSILLKVAASVQGGISLAKSFGEYPAYFNNIFTSLVDAGEQSGTLDKSLQRLADQQEKEQQVLRQVRGALIYPMIVLVVIVLVVVFMLTTVLPQVATLYKELGQTLPILTQILLAISNAAVNYWYIVLLLLLAAGFGIRAYVQTTSGRKAMDGFKMRLPVFGLLFKKVYAARFTRTLSSLVNSGVPLLKAIRISGESVDNVVVKAIIFGAGEKVKVGESLSSALAGHDEIIKLVPQMIAVGEESGTLGTMLEKVATFFEEEVDQAVKNITGIIEPFMIIFLGLTVIFIVIAVLYPIYGLVNVVGTSSSGGSGGF